MSFFSMFKGLFEFQIKLQQHATIFKLTNQCSLVYYMNILKHMNLITAIGQDGEHEAGYSSHTATNQWEWCVSGAVNCISCMCTLSNLHLLCKVKVTLWEGLLLPCVTLPLSTIDTAFQHAFPNTGCGLCDSFREVEGAVVTPLDLNTQRHWGQ